MDFLRKFVDHKKQPKNDPKPKNANTAPIFRSIDILLALNNSPWRDIPDPIVVQVLEFLELNDLANVSLVCHKWKRLSDDDQIWKPRCQKQFNIKHKLHSQNWKQFYTAMKVELKLQQEEYMEILSNPVDYLCGLRCEPESDPQRPVPTVGVNEFVPVGGFLEHPNKSSNQIIKFGVHLYTVALELLMLLKHIERDTRFAKEEWVVVAMRRYDMFLQLKAKYPQTVLIPTLDIELVWISHLLRPMKYKEDCMKIYKVFIDHELLADASQQGFHAQALEETATLWKQHYNEEYCDLPAKTKHRRYEHAPFEPPKNVMPKCVYYQQVPLNYNQQSAKGWQNPFQLTAKNIIDDRLWYPSFFKFIGPQFSRLTNRVIRRGVKAYERFMFMAAKYPPGSGELVHPTHAIDIIWHSHMIHPKLYHEESRKYVGYVMDHDPWPDIPVETMASSYNKTNQLWVREFAIPMDKEHALEDWDNEHYDDYDTCDYYDFE